MPHILIASDSFKGALSAAQATEAIGQGVIKAAPHASIDLCPIADGGEGTAELIGQSMGARLQRAQVIGPQCHPIDTTYWLTDRGEAIIEVASAAGLTWVPIEERDPHHMTTFGVGQLIHHALRQGAQKMTLCLGGSATCDLGLGILQSLGAQLTPLSSPITPARFDAITQIDLSEPRRLLENIQLTLLYDVNTPLLGPSGGVRTYGPQKGAVGASLDRLERRIESLTHRLLADSPHINPQSPGFGAAGGVAVGLSACASLTLKKGAAYVLDLLDFNQRLGRADWVITGEGQLDAQSHAGKAPWEVLDRARLLDTPIVAIVGSQVGPPPPIPIYAITHHAPDLETSIRDAIKYLRHLGILFVSEHL